MNKILKTAAMLVALSMGTSAEVYIPSGMVDDILCFPHQMAVADLIFTGTVATTNNMSADVIIDELLWGGIASTNITVRSVVPSSRFDLPIGHRYLFFAFTNNWWESCSDINESTCKYLADYFATTNFPPNNAVFGDCRVIDTRYSAIDFSRLSFGGTNYWPDTRSFITNYLDIIRVQHNEEKARTKLDAVARGGQSSACLPHWLRIQIEKYSFRRFQCDEDL